ncbi:MAG: ATP-binding cassette domain-containing protein [Proteobacteria bacterium]|nr:MAG: ATP-binding cassette domain-containing protein [Pseudomonadota bacterium]
MNLLQLQNGVKTFGARTLFDHASFAINVGEKVGVIGPNGAGKTTLFKILVGTEQMDSGQIIRMNGLRLGYLAQEDHWGPEDTIESYLCSQHATPIWELKQMAPKFGLPVERFGERVASLSGGYRMRAKLLHLLASKPDLMLLDEPTNYLDLETLVVLENFLLDAPSAFLLISHDREFLRRVTDHILEIEAGEMTKYAGNIDDYFEQKELMRQQLEKQAMTAQAKRQEVLDFAAKFGAKATKARQVQSRLKQLDKMESIEIKAVPLSAKIRLPEPARSGRQIVKLEHVALGYGDKTILRDVDFTLEKGNHLGVVGVNGAGKSTFLKALSGELKPLTGELSKSDEIDVAYFAQHVADRLDPNDTVLEAMSAEAPRETTRQAVLDLAGSLLFGGDDVAKKIRVLSGGEKSRVALGRMLLKRSSLLLLDEPTNHLDFHTVEALTQALADYAGAFVIVSHDRGFVRRTASKILEIRDGKAEFYPGSYDEYVWSVQKGALSERDSSESTAGVKTSDEKPVRSGDTTSETRFNFKERKKALEKEVRTCEKEITRIDKDMENLKTKILALTDELMTLSGVKAAEKAKELGSAQGEIEKSEGLYLEFLERHEVASQELALMDNRRTD